MRFQEPFIYIGDIQCLEKKIDCILIYIFWNYCFMQYILTRVLYLGALNSVDLPKRR